jgi:hypothetical protein
MVLLIHLIWRHANNFVLISTYGQFGNALLQIYYYASRNEQIVQEGLVELYYEKNSSSLGLDYQIYSRK